MGMDERTNELLHSKFEQVFGEPEATLVMNRLASTEDFRLVKDEIIRVEHRLELFEERLRAEIQSTARKNLATMVTTMGIFNAVLFAALKFT
jgi:hypothetical protein